MKTYSLTSRQGGVLSLVAEGMSNKEIAAQLHLAESTVKNHLAHIFAELSAHGRTHAVVLAYRWGLLDLNGFETSRRSFHQQRLGSRHRCFPHRIKDSVEVGQGVERNAIALLLDCI